MSRTLQQIKDDIETRFLSNEYLPQYIKRTEDLEKFAKTFSEFISPFIKKIEDFENIWNDISLLRRYLENKHMYFNGNETLEQLQDIAKNRLKIIASRGTMNMKPEIQRLCNEFTETEINFKDFGECGWVAGRTSPCYRESVNDANVSYIGIRELVIFDLKNQNIFYTNEQIKEILEKYFIPQHISVIYNFL